MRRGHYGGKSRAKLTYQCPKCGDWYTRGFHSADKSKKPVKRICSNCK